MSDPNETKDDASEPKEAPDSGTQEVSEEEAKKAAIKERNQKWEDDANKHTHMGYPF
jgi:hypothetical protein